METVLRLEQVMLVTGLKRSTLHLYVTQGKFPRQIKLGPKASGWLASEVQAWIDARKKASRGDAK
ncbi:MAG: AlpA family transcriptional regulator [Luteibacter sp.]